MEEYDVELNSEDFDENAKFRLTPNFILYQTLDDYGIEVGEWKPKLWEKIFEDIMDSLCRSEYLQKVADNEN